MGARESKRAASLPCVLCVVCIVVALSSSYTQYDYIYIISVRAFSAYCVWAQQSCLSYDDGYDRIASEDRRIFATHMAHTTGEHTLKEREKDIA